MFACLCRNSHCHLGHKASLLSTELITDNQIENGLLKADLKDKVMYTLLRKHRHQTKKSNLRSLADIGKTVSSASRLFTNQEAGNTDASLMQSLFCYHSKTFISNTMLHQPTILYFQR